MKRITLIITLLSFFIISCENSEADPADNDQTLLMYFPWSGNLLGEFQNNISGMEEAIAENILKNERVLVFFQTSTEKAVLFELKWNKKKKCIADTLKYYNNPEVTTRSGIASILNDVKHYAPARRYAMSVGAHGMAWLPAASAEALARGSEYYQDIPGMIKTRYFGGHSSYKEWRTNTTTFAEGVADAGIKMEYILMDACFMSSVEVAYEFKDITDYLVSSPTEVVSDGVPFNTVAKHMLGTVNYEGICYGFLTYYQNHRAECGTISVIKTSELDDLAVIMKDINKNYTFDESLRSKVQRLEAYSQTYFFDYSDYVSKLCTDEGLVAAFEQQLERVVPTRYRKHTEYLFSTAENYFYGKKIKLNAYCGISTSDPSINPVADAKNQTAWYKATH